MLREAPEVFYPGEEDFAEALRVAPEPFPAARLALHNAMRDFPRMRFPPLHDRVHTAAFSADGKRVLGLR